VLPKRYAYLIAVGTSDLLGILWISLSYRNLKLLQKLPTHKWYLMKPVNKNEATASEEQDQNEHEVSFIPKKETNYIT
jgi:hypothetical protein